MHETCEDLGQNYLKLDIIQSLALPGRVNSHVTVKICKQACKLSALCALLQRFNKLYKRPMAFTRYTA